MNRTITTILTLCILVLAAGCGDAFVPPTAPRITVEEETAWGDGQASVTERLAKSMAEALADPAFRESLYEEAAEKYTGDTEALYVRLASERVGGTTWENRLDVDARPEDTERLHFYVYGIEYSNPGHAPLVAVGAGDENVRELKAYDSRGNEYAIDAQAPPTQTIVVVGLNERIDAQGQPREFADITTLTRVAADAPGGGGGRGGGGGGTGGNRVAPHSETMERIYLVDDNESWWRGSPEIMMQMNVLKWPNNAAWRGSFPGVNKEHRWYYVDQFLFNWYRDPPNNDYGAVASIMWWEEDGGFPITVGVEYPFGGENGGKITFTFEMKSNDQEMGSVLINFEDPLDTVYDTGDIKWEHN